MTVTSVPWLLGDEHTADEHQRENRDTCEAEDLLDEPLPAGRPRRAALSRARQVAGLALAVAGLPLLTLLLTAVGDALVARVGQVLLYLLAVVGRRRSPAA